MFRWGHDSGGRPGLVSARSGNYDCDVGRTSQAGEEHAVTWYVRRLLLDELGDDTSQADLSRRYGMSEAQISQIKSGRAVGLRTLIRLAEARGTTAGTILDQSLSWWRSGGAAEAAAALAEQHAERVQGLAGAKTATK